MRRTHTRAPNTPPCGEASATRTVAAAAPVDEGIYPCLCSREEVRVEETTYDRAFPVRVVASLVGRAVRLRHRLLARGVGVDEGKSEGQGVKRLHRRPRRDEMGL